MSTDNVALIIDNICSKIGVASQIGIEEFAKYNIGRSLCDLIFSICIFIAMFIVCKIALKGINNHRDEFSDPTMAAMGVYGIVGLLSTFNLINFYDNLRTLIGFIISPTGATISYIIYHLK